MDTNTFVKEEEDDLSEEENGDLYYRTKYLEVANELEQLKESFLEYKKSSEELEQELETELEKSSNRNTELEEQLERLKQELKQLQLSKFSPSKHSQMDDIQKLLDQIHELQEKEESAKKKIIELQVQNEKLENSLRVAEASIENLTEKLDQETERVILLQGEVEELQQQSSIIQRLRDELRELKEEKNNRKTQMEHLHLREERDTLMQKLQSVELETNGLSEEKTKLEVKITELLHQLNSSKHDSSLEDQLEVYKSAKQSYEDTISKLHERVTMLEELNQMQSENLEKAKKEIKFLSAKDELEACKHQISQLKQELEDKDHQLQQLNTSISQAEEEDQTSQQIKNQQHQELENALKRSGLESFELQQKLVAAENALEEYKAKILQERSQLKNEQELLSKSLQEKNSRIELLSNELENVKNQQILQNEKNLEAEAFKRKIEELSQQLRQYEKNSLEKDAKIIDLRQELERRKTAEHDFNAARMEEVSRQKMELELEKNKLLQLHNDKSKQLADILKLKTDVEEKLLQEQSNTRIQSQRVELLQSELKQSKEIQNSMLKTIQLELDKEKEKSREYLSQISEYEKNFKQLSENVTNSSNVSSIMLKQRENELELKTVEANELKQKLVTYMQENERITKLCTELKLTNQNLQAELEKKQNELNQIKKTLSMENETKSLEIDELKHKIHIQTKELEQKSRELMEVQHNFRESTKMNEQKTVEMNEWKQKITVAFNENDQKYREISEMRSKLKSMQDTIDLKNKEVIALKDQLTNNLQEMLTVQSTCEKYSVEIFDLRHKLQMAEKEKDSLMINIQKLKNGVVQDLEHQQKSRTLLVKRDKSRQQKNDVSSKLIERIILNAEGLNNRIDNWHQLVSS